MSLDTEEKVLEEATETKDHIYTKINFEDLNRIQQLFLQNTIIRNNIEGMFELVVKDIDVLESNDEVVKIKPNSTIYISCKTKDSEDDEKIFIELITDELMITDGNDMMIAIHQNDRIYVKDEKNNITFKGFVSAFGYDYENNDIEIDVIVGVNGSLGFVRLSYNEEGVKIFSMGSNISDRVKELADFIER